MKHPTSRGLYAYWNLRRGKAAAPSSSDIEPLELGTTLVDIFLLRFEDGDFARFRFCGSNLATRFGRDLTDEDFLGLWSQCDRDSLIRHLRALTGRMVSVVAGSLAETAGSGFTAYEYMLLPLITDSVCDRAIGCMVRTGGNETKNRLRLRILSQELRSARIIDPQLQPNPLAPFKKSDAQTSTPLFPVPSVPIPNPANRRYRHLYVLEGGK